MVRGEEVRRGWHMGAKGAEGVEKRERCRGDKEQ